MRALRCRRGTGAFAHHASAAPRPAGTRLAWLAQCSLGECGSKCSAATYLGAWFPTLALPLWSCESWSAVQGTWGINGHMCTKPYGLRSVYTHTVRGAESTGHQHHGARRDHPAGWCVGPTHHPVWVNLRRPQNHRGQLRINRPKPPPRARFCEKQHAVVAHRTPLCC